jgi:hypothetical protein
VLITPCCAQATWPVKIMKKLSLFLAIACLTLSLTIVVPAVAQNAPRTRALVVNGRTTDGAVVQIDGHSYVDVETLAQVLGAAVRLEPGRVVLTSADSEIVAKSGHATPALSKEFARAAISQLADMREWKGAISSVIRSGVAGGNWLAPLLHEHRVRAEESLDQASVAATTDSDKLALQLLRGEFTNLGQWDSNTQATILSLNAEQNLNPATARNDPLLAKISECGGFLNAMLVGGEFADSLSCH